MVAAQHPAAGMPEPARIDSMEGLMQWTRTVLRSSDDLLAASARTLPALVAQLEQAIGTGTVPPSVIPLVTQAKHLEQRIHASRARGREVLARWG